MSTFWSMAIFIFDMYLLFTVIYWASTSTMPQGNILFVEIFLETIMIIELLTRLLLSQFASQSFKNLNLLHTSKGDGIMVYLGAGIGSIPFVIIYTSLGDPSQLANDVFSRVLLLKITRSFEI